jgi:phage terminase large subunit GpA-like protein
MTGANSAVGLRSMPVRYLFLDEVDGYPLDVEGEGDAISLAEARTRTFARRKIFIVSTPTIAGASAIEREYEASDQRRYFVPCPHCSHRQWLRFEQLRWDKGAPETSAYICESCDTAIAEHHKTWMLEHGEWRAMAQVAGKTAGFHLSSLYSPVGWRAWRDIAAAWEAAVSKESGSASAIKTFKNTELGEAWVEEGEAPDWQRLIERREDYRIGTVPLGGLLLVGGADVQKDRIEVSIWAFGRSKECWLVEHRVLMGDTARDGVWKSFSTMLEEQWTHASGALLPLVRIALDTGFATQEAYAFVRASRDARLMAIKGTARGAALIGTPTAVDVSRDGKRLRRGIKVYSVAVGIAKLEFYNNLRKSATVGDDGVTLAFPSGFVHLPLIDAEFVQQLCAEQLITRRDRNGFPVREWQKVRERNEALDCYIYARAAAAAAGLDRFEERHWRELERPLGIARAAESAPVLRLDDQATLRGGPSHSGAPIRRRVVKSRWLS